MKSTMSSYEAPHKTIFTLGEVDMRHEALKRILYPRELSVCPVASPEGTILNFIEAPESWAVYKAQILETYFLLQICTKISAIPVTYEHEGTTYSILLERSHVVNQLADAIRREFIE